MASVQPPDDSAVCDDGVVALRRWRESDVQAVWAARRDDEECARFLVGAPWPFGLDDAERIVSQFIAEHPQRGFALVRADDGAFVGAALLRLVGGQPPEIGYWTAPGWRGAGYATRAARLLLKWVWEELAPSEIRLYTHPHNVASQRIARRLAFQEVEPVPYGKWADGETHAAAFVMRPHA
jgi:RimJ/RimL family protein N-acetyltransferase